MSRLPILRERDLEPEQSAVHTSIAHGRRAAFFRSIGADPKIGLPGPFNAMVLAPAVGMPLHRLGEALRYDGIIPPLIRELVILYVAKTQNSPFEWASHAPLAMELGAADQMLDAIRSGTPSVGSQQADTALRFARAVLASDDVDDELYEACRAEFGDKGLVELIVLVGYYRLLADLMRVAEVE